MMEKGRNMWHPTSFFPSPSFYYIHCSDAWNAFQTHTFRSRRPLRAPLHWNGVAPSDVIWNKFHVTHWHFFLLFFCKGPSTPKRVSLTQVSRFTTMYVVKWWHLFHLFQMKLVSSACHHFTTYIPVKRDTCVNDTRFGVDGPLANGRHENYFKWHLMVPNVSI